MTHDLKTHAVHYAVLLLGLSLGLLGLTLGHYNPRADMTVIGLMAAGYVGWGIVHHALLHDLNVKIVLEYLLVAGLAGLVLGAIMI